MWSVPPLFTAPSAAVIWLSVPRVRWTMKGYGEQEEILGIGRRSKAYSATIFLTERTFYKKAVENR